MYLIRPISPKSESNARITLKGETITVDESAHYAARKDELFSVEKSPQRIITRLADTTHAFQSRTDRLLEVLAECQGRTLVLCNLSSYAKSAQSAAKKVGHRSVVATSYQVAMREEIAAFDNVVYLESPIVNSFYLLDSEEMKLLAISMEEDGVTQPVVVFYDATIDTYIVVDGFHRYSLMKHYFGCEEIPVVVIDKSIQDRMASTIRHNRARGKHQVDLMSVMVERLLKLGWDDLDIAKHLGMEAEEVLRLKQMTGLAGLFKGQAYSRSWIKADDQPIEAN